MRSRRRPPCPDNRVMNVFERAPCGLRPTWAHTKSEVDGGPCPLFAEIALWTFEGSRFGGPPSPTACPSSDFVLFHAEKEASDDDSQHNAHNPQPDHPQSGHRSDLPGRVRRCEQASTRG